MGTGSFPGVKCGRGVLMTTHPLIVPRSWKSRAITLPTFWATTGPVTGTHTVLMSPVLCLQLLPSQGYLRLKLTQNNQLSEKC